MDAIYQQIVTVIVAIIGSIDVVGIVGVIIAAIKNRINMKKEIATTKQQIEDAFKNAVLPKNIKLDVSRKIEKPIRDGLEDIKLYIEQALERIDTGERLILSILSLFSHVKQLPEDVQKQIEDYIELNTSEEIQID